MLMKSLGFDFVISQDSDGVEEPCYELSLSMASPHGLRATSDMLTTALSYVRGV